MKVILTIGISSSGKNDWAKQFVADKAAGGEPWQVITRDSLRREILEEKIGRPLKPSELWERWNFGNEKKVNDLQHDKLNDAFLANAAGIVIADTNLTAEGRDKLLDKLTSMAKAHKVPLEVSVKEFPVAFDFAYLNNSMSSERIPDKVIAQQYIQWLAYKDETAAAKAPKSSEHQPDR